MLLNIFTYGTLMFQPVWLKVTGILCKSQNARVYGFKRKAVKNQLYPVLLPAEKNQVVPGVIYFDIDEYVLKILAYYRTGVEALVNENHMIKAQTYVLKKEYYSVIDNRKWDPLQFERMHITYFLKENL